MPERIGLMGLNRGELVLMAIMLAIIVYAIIQIVIQVIHMLATPHPTVVVIIPKPISLIAP